MLLRQFQSALFILFPALGYLSLLFQICLLLIIIVEADAWSEDDCADEASESTQLVNDSASREVDEA